MAAKKIKNRKPLVLWRNVTIAAMELPVDLSTRQMAILLTVHLEPGPHGIKALSESLGISKAAMSRAVDMLEDAKLLRRSEDRNDKRNTLLIPTPKGSTFLQEFASLISNASR